MKRLNAILAVGGLLYFAAAQSIQATTYQNLTAANVRRDSGLTGPAVEEVHYYYDQWPIGLAVSKQGRIFVCYTRGTYVSRTHRIALSFQRLSASSGIHIGRGLQHHGRSPVPQSSNEFASRRPIHIAQWHSIW